MTHYNKNLFKQGSKNIFCFGSNLAGRHGKGAAKFAFEHCGARYGVGVGLCGNSFAIPTKDEYLRVLSLDTINAYVQQFLQFARNNHQLIFYVTAIGTGLAAYQHYHIAPLFKDSPSNCILPDEWQLGNQPSLLLVDNLT